MLTAPNPRETDCRSHPVGEQRWQGARILMSDYSCNGPGCSGMFRGKRRAPIEEGSAPVALVRALASEGVLQNFSRDQAVHSCLACKKSRLTPALVVRRIAEQIKSCANASQACYTKVRNCFVVV